ncbi:MAG: acyl-CoA dehydrogenase [Sphingopyxis sp.]
MNLTPDDDQRAFVTATADWCRDTMPLEDARDRPADLWNQLEAMGLPGLTAPEANGGLALDHATEVLVFAELGRHLAPVALPASAVAARWTGTRGKAALAVAASDGLRLLDGDAAQHGLGIFDGRVGHFALPAGLVPGHSLDPSAALVRLSAMPLTKTVDDPRAALQLQLLAAAFSVGCADAARDMAVDYAKVREQFERPIGSFQAIKHMCADMAVRAAVARSQLYYAACALDAEDADTTFHVAAAKRLADQAALDNGRVNIQIHGGIGMTDEAFPHFCLKRAHLLQFVAPVDAAVLLAA